jgi:hypothetical protein
MRHLSDPHAGAYCPGWQGVQEASPANSVKVPGGHAAQEEEDSSVTNPLRHVEQPVEPPMPTPVICRSRVCAQRQDLYSGARFGPDLYQ